MPEKNVKRQYSAWRKKVRSSKREKRRRKEEKLIKQYHAAVRCEEGGVSTSAKPCVQDSKQGSSATLSVAVPGSILDNAQSLELKTYLAGQIARAAAIFRVAEIVVYDESAQLSEREIDAFESSSALGTDASGMKPNCNLLLARILQYLECPQYLRRQLFSLQKELRFAGLLNPLNCPHHLKADDVHIPFREAVVLSKPPKEGKGSYCNAGLAKDLQIDLQLQPYVRVTIKLDTRTLDKKRPKATVVSPTAPTEEIGLYWGYNVRLASSFGAVFKQCPYAGGYDLTIGTSDRGENMDDLMELKPFRHCLVAFGGIAGLESSCDADQALSVTDPAQLFDHYLNCCWVQGSRTIRTEEAILISLSGLRQRLVAAGGSDTETLQRNASS